MRPQPRVGPSVRHRDPDVLQAHGTSSRRNTTEVTGGKAQQTKHRPQELENLETPSPTCLCISIFSP